MDYKRSLKRRHVSPTKSKRITQWRNLRRSVQNLSQSIQTNNNIESVNCSSYSSSASMLSGDDSSYKTCASQDTLFTELNDNQEKDLHDISINNESYKDLVPLEPFKNELKCWSLKHGCTRQCVNDLLNILIRNGHKELPKDARSLLCTPKVVSTTSMHVEGKYIYFGVRQGIENILKHHIFNETQIKLISNVDGLPVFKSSSYQIWPILCQFGHFKPFVVALYGGVKKPIASEFLNDFAKELQTFDSPVAICGKEYSISVFAISCDSPARSLLKGTVEHSGYYSCERCNEVGVSIRNRIVFTNTKLNILPRTNTELKAGIYSQADSFGRCHHHSLTPLYNVHSIDMVCDFPLDYMHLVCLGAMRRILYYFKGAYKGILKGRLSASSIGQISCRLTNLNGKLPTEFARQPRSLIELNRWKATEFRMFLLYVGIVALKGILDHKAYKHFLSLVLSIRMLCEDNNETRRIFLSSARQLLLYFVSNCHEHYGDTFCVYNIHSLIHIADDVEHFDAPLDFFSCFQFENHLQMLKHLVRGRNNPLIEISKRLSESKGSFLCQEKTVTKIDTSKNSCFLTKSHVIFVKEILVNGNIVCDVLEKERLDNFFDDFVESKTLNIYCIRANHVCMSRQISKDRLLRKCLCLPFKNDHIVISLLNDVKF
ncbi:uncharacterized protein LOC124817377 isoform X1 [Hydra vulgaris]|uniref:uncharacterized protein LOC124817377 isoform X1 n=2 Tax=Hydra vulgaris TaxID=6087 RepID=UPI001F5F5B39|nr:uncharacterized protein LOC124817377 isoform X1 [Hydra vulgaris]